jgi:hypothetical protein
MVAAINRLGSHLAPGSFCRIPKLGRVNRFAGIEAVKFGPLGAPCHKHGAVRQKGGIVLAPTKLHRSNDGPGGFNSIQIDGLHEVGGRSAAYENDLAHVIHQRWCVIGVLHTAGSDGNPRALIAGAKSSKR